MPAPLPAISPTTESALADLGEHIRNARLKRLLTQEMLGERSGVGRRVIAKLERSPGNVPTGVLLEVLGVFDPNMVANAVAALANDPIGETLARQRMPSRAVPAKDDF